jgi:hypothetical protein
MVETVAAYLGILDIVVRLARYGDRRLSKGVTTALRAVDEPEQHFSVDEARRTFEAELVRQLGADRARTVQRAVEVVEEVISKSFDPAILNTHQILPYGTLLSGIVTAIGKHLNQLRVIEAWKAYEWQGADKKTTNRLLLLPYTWQLLGLCQPRFRKSKRRARLSLHQQIELPGGWNERYFLESLIHRPGEISPVRSSVNFASDYNLVFANERFFGVPHEVNIDSFVFEALLLGLLMDAIAYHQRAMSEILRSKSFIRSLLGFGRDELRPPF